MATSRPFAYNTGSAIAGTEQVGDIAIGTPTSGFTSTGLIWWNGPDEDSGYVIAHTVPSGTQPNPVGVPAYVGFWRTSSKTDNDFISLSEYVSNLTGTPQTFADTLAAKTWLNSEGYWTSYTPMTSLVLSLDAGDPASYPGTGTVWTDTIGGRTFNLTNGPTYETANNGRIKFNAASTQYAECSSSLTSLPTFTTAVWHNWDGANTGGLPCILSEVYVGGPINYFLGNLQGSVAQSGYFNGGFQVSPQFTLTANNWYYIVTTCDSNQDVKVYINNTLVSTTTTAGAVPSSSNAGIRLMSRWDNLDCWGGYLSQVEIYNEALTGVQISSIWNSTKSRYGFGAAVSPTVTSDSYGSLSNSSATVTGTITSDGGSTILERGIVWDTSQNPTISNNKVAGTGTAVGTFTQNYAISNPYQLIYVRVYATNAIGTGYGSQLSFTLPCFVKGTKITMYDGSRKNIEDISYEDNLLVWNFDDGRFDSAKPLWIMNPVKTPSVNILFSDGSKLGISGYLQHDGGHRIFNLDKGEFTYAIPNEHTPIGTKTFNDKGEIVTIVGKEEGEFSEIYNVVTNRHLNIFASGALTSRRLNNIYPISDMKFIKEERTITPIEEFMGITEEYYNGLRLGEQPLVKVSEGFLTKSPGELAYTLPTVEELVEWTEGFIQKKYEPVYEDTIS